MKPQLVILTGGIFETISYCNVTSYYLSIEHSLLNNQFLSSANDTDLFWYCKYGGGNNGLKVILHLKDENGRILNPSLIPLEMNTELVYDYGYATTFTPLSTLKEKKYSRASKNSTAWLAVTILLV